jgi:hypothetical protein
MLEGRIIQAQNDSIAPVHRLAQVAPEFGSRFCLFIDTEEDFDWSAPFSRDNHGLASVAALRPCQTYFAAAHVKPLYLVDYPIVQSDMAVDILGPHIIAGACDVGVQLHPWVNPPFDEDISVHNSFAGNLPLDLERQKIEILRTAIIDRFGSVPLAYRAGRYGLGPNSLKLLVQTGFKLDSSVRSGFDYSPQNGPNYAKHPLHPYWTGPDAKILELPLTSVFSGALGKIGQGAHALASQVAGGGALLARLGLTERIALTPEGIPAAKACTAIDVSLDMGIALLNMSFHSPSLMPGHTPYVRTANDLASFYLWWDVVLNHLAKKGVQPASQSEILASIT